MKKIILMCAALALLLTTGIGTTFAMSNGTDATGSGVSTEQVNIKLVQQMRGGDGELTDFIYHNILGGDTIYPSYYPDDMLPKKGSAVVGGESYAMWNNAEVMGVVDQVVTVKNEEWFADCYVRVYFAFEGGVDNLFINKNETDWKWATVAEDVTITATAKDGSLYTGRYDVLCATYQKVLESGKITSPSLLQMALDGENTDHAFFETVGDTYETLIYAQAIQSSGFDGVDAAFAAVAPKDFQACNWAVSSAEEY